MTEAAFTADEIDCGQGCGRGGRADALWQQRPWGEAWRAAEADCWHMPVGCRDRVTSLTGGRSPRGLGGGLGWW